MDHRKAIAINDSIGRDALYPGFSIRFCAYFTEKSQPCHRLPSTSDCSHGYALNLGQTRSFFRKRDHTTSGCTSGTACPQIIPSATLPFNKDPSARETLAFAIGLVQEH